MKQIKLFLIIVCTQSLFSQIKTCSECDTQIYSYQYISNLSLLELKILRNEIFARHQYVFKDERLSDHFLKNYDWYILYYNSENNIELNTIEKQNISLLLKYETKKQALKTIIIEELNGVKKAVINNDTISINAIIHKVIDGSGTEYAREIKKELKGILSQISINKIHWYN